MSDTVTAALIASIAPALFFLYTVLRDWSDRQFHRHLKLEAVQQGRTTYITCTDLGKYPVGVESPRIVNPLPEGGLLFVPWLGVAHQDSPFAVLEPGASKRVSSFNDCAKEVSVTTNSGKTKKAKVRKLD